MNIKIKNIIPHLAIETIDASKIFAAIIAAILTMVADIDAVAQQSKPVKITGQVIGPDGDPIIGALVISNKSVSGTSTDGDGIFEYTTTTSDLPLSMTIKFVGYKDQSFVVYNEQQADAGMIALDEEGYSLNDVVVVGYGEQTRKKLTGAISKLSADLIKESPKDAPVLALQGNVPGVYINQGSGVPGDGATTVQIRGVSTMTSNNDPLYIVDGIPFNANSTNPVAYTSTGIFSTPDPLTLINPADIESIEILKDADATAIYGTKGTNGVVLITTKKGSSGDVQVRLDVSRTAQFMNKRLDFLNTKDYVALRKEAFEADLARGDVKESDFNENNFPDLFLWDQEKDYDWQEVILGNTAWATNADLSLWGGNKNTTFRASASYYKAGTITVGDDKYKRYSGRFNFQHSSNDNRLKIEAGVGVTHLRLDADASGSAYLSLSTAPNRPVYDDEGKPYWIPDDTGDTAPLRVLNYDGTNRVTSLTSNFLAQYRIWDELRFKVSLGYDFSSSRQDSYYYRSYYNPYKSDQHDYGDYFTKQTGTFIIEPQLTYDINIGPGRLNLLVGVSKQNSETNSTYFEGQDYPGEMFLKDANAAAAVSTHSTPRSQTKNASFFAKAGYDLYNRYIVNVNYRRDGSSRFGTNEQYGNFYSVGLAWIVSNEKFITENNINKVLSHAKLRASFGRTGNDGISDYAYLAKYSTNRYPYENNVGIYPKNIANPDLKWETTNKFDIGAEVGVIKDRIIVSANYYKNVSTDLLRSMTIPSQTGFTSITTNMDAEIENYGVEIELNSTNIRKNNFVWTTSFNISIPTNKLTKFENLENSSYRTSYDIGRSINILKRYKFTGINEQTGLAEVEDTNGDGIINSDDYQTIGDTDPSYYGGITNTLKYKGFTLDFSFYFRKVDWKYGYLWNFDDPIGMCNNVTRDQANNYWKKPGDKAKYPALTTTSSSDVYKSFFNYMSYSDAAYSSGSFFKLSNVKLSYDFPVELIAKAHLSQLQLYTQGSNLFMITNYDAYNPETGSNVPATTSITFGLIAQF